MPTIHPVVDADLHFIIDPVTRVIANDSGKTVLIQYDHNSERYGFTLPRYVEGHDMSLCNRVEVHYDNVASSGGRTYHGLYDVVDMAVNPDNEEEVVFTWLVSANATQLIGSLRFVIRMSCVDDDGTIIYAWHTAVYSGIVVSPGIYNSEEVMLEYADILAQWELEFGKAYTDISIDADLDSFTESGWYRCPSAEIAKSLTNCPVECPFVMRIVCSSDDLVTDGGSVYTKTRILFPHDADTAFTSSDPVTLSMEQVYVVNSDGTEGWYGRWYKSHEIRGLQLDADDPYTLQLTASNAIGMPKPFADVDLSPISKKTLNINGSNLELQRADGTVESSVGVSAIVPSYSYTQQATLSSDATRSSFTYAINSLGGNKCLLTHYVNKAVYVRMEKTPQAFYSDPEVYWQSEEIAANSYVYIEFDRLSNVFTIYVQPSDSLMAMPLITFRMEPYPCYWIGVATVDSEPFGEGLAVRHYHTYG